MILFRYLVFVFAVVKCDWFVSGSTITQQQKLVANDGAAYDQFGSSVALDGDTLVVGADWDDDKGSASGSVYVFVRSGTTWTQQQILIANDGGSGDFFGARAALDGDVYTSYIKQAKRRPQPQTLDRGDHGTYFHPTYNIDMHHPSTRN